MEPNVSTSKPKSNLAIPIAIILAGIFIAGAIYFSGRGAPEPKTDLKQAVSGLSAVREVSKDDHIRGNPNARLYLIEYSDTECPFCARFHATMKKIMDEYGKTGQVAWVYRHYPLDQLHPRARTEAVALECVNDLSGDEKFWAFTDALYALKLASQVQIQVDLPKLAAEQGIDVVKFNQCLASGKFDKKVEADAQNAQLTGGNGTPWSILVTSDGKMTSINGAYPYENVKQIIDNLLK